MYSFSVFFIEATSTSEDPRPAAPPARATSRCAASATRTTHRSTSTTRRRRPQERRGFWEPRLQCTNCSPRRASRHKSPNSLSMQFDSPRRRRTSPAPHQSSTTTEQHLYRSPRPKLRHAPSWHTHTRWSALSSPARPAPHALRCPRLRHPWGVGDPRNLSCNAPTLLSPCP